MGNRTETGYKKGTLAMIEFWAITTAGGAPSILVLEH